MSVDPSLLLQLVWSLRGPTQRNSVLNSVLGWVLCSCHKDSEMGLQDRGFKLYLLNGPQKKCSDMALFLFPKTLWKKTHTIETGYFVHWKWLVEAFRFRVRTTSPVNEACCGVCQISLQPHLVPSLPVSSLLPAINFPASRPIANVLSGGSSATLFKTLFCCLLNFTAGI